MAQPFSLAWLLDPLPVDDFLGTIWGTTHHHVSRGRPDYLDSLRDGADSVDDLLALFRPHLALVSLVRESERKDQYVYRRADGAFDAAAIGRDFADGYTIVLDSVQRYAPAIAVLSQSLEVELNFATQVNAYFTPPASQGFAAHSDDHDTLIVQLHGSKIWHLYEGVDVAPHEMWRHEAMSTAGLPDPIDIRLEPGDVLYVPRGRVHAAESTSEVSVHLTVSLHAPTLFLLATRALNALSNTDDRIHTQLPPRFLSDPDVRSGLGGLARQIAAALEQPESLAGGLDSLEADLVRRGQCKPLGAGISNAVAIDDQTRVVTYQPLYSRVTEGSDEVALHFAQSVVNVPADHRDALRFLTKSTAPFRIRDLPELSEVQRLEFARTLILQGFLIRLPDD
ncbi:cupin domain-containing protein [Mycobacterium sp.]|uniref:JmjC domain-containing protein n=1 Tax=Mycobacterium sp. TaxID=1785 RepID=UPI0025CEE402|nr:cupin domain-containing protein [Mycobacterium sp.]